MLDLSSPVVMGIINLSPDSFYAGSRVEAMEKLLEKAEKLLGTYFKDRRLFRTNLITIQYFEPRLLVADSRYYNANHDSPYGK